jgi:hypothetical protein
VGCTVLYACPGLGFKVQGLVILNFSLCLAMFVVCTVPHVFRVLISGKLSIYLNGLGRAGTVPPQAGETFAGRCDYESRRQIAEKVLEI